MQREWVKAMREAGVPKQYRLRVQERLVVLEFALREGVRPAGRRFGVTSRTVRRWKQRWRAEGIHGLIPRYPVHRKRRISEPLIDLIRHARVDFSYGATRTQLWLWRVHRLRVSQTTIQRVVRELGLPKVKPVRKRRPRQLKLFERDRPGDCVQVDVKFVRAGGQRLFQYTALDDCTRYRILRLYRQLNHRNSIAFFREVQSAFPFPIRQLQTDNGNEFSLAFRLTVQEAGIEHRYIRPRRPQQNGKVERSHRIDAEEFWSRQRLRSFGEAEVALRMWEHHYNAERFSMALRGETPAERLATKLAA
jgi:transposase InsO family protein